MVNSEEARNGIMRYFAVILCAIVFGSAMSAPAKALVYNFSFMNEDGVVPGVVEGYFDLAGYDGVFTPAEVYITSAPLGAFMSVDGPPFRAQARGGVPNSFTVNNGVITDFTFQGGSPNTEFTFSSGGPAGLGFFGASHTLTYKLLDADGSTLVFQPTFTVYEFSFMNEDGSQNGQVDGRFVLPIGDGIHAALSVVLDSVVLDNVPAGSFAFTPPERLAPFGTNSFTVENGVITDFMFDGATRDKEFNISTDGPARLLLYGWTEIYTVLDDDGSTLEVRSLSPIPLPATALMMVAGVAGLAALGAVRRRG